MSVLRQQMIKDMQIRGFTPGTQEAYVNAVSGIAKHYHLSPDTLTPQQLKDYIFFLINDRKLAWSSINGIASALRFFYGVTVCNHNMTVAIPPRKTPRRLPQILSKEELLRIFSAIRNQKHRTVLMTAYAAGLRISEVVNLRAEDIDSKRMMIRVVQGKGQKDRYTLLSPRLLIELRSYWKTYHPKTLFFTANGKPDTQLSANTARRIMLRLKSKLGITKKITPHTLRHCFATHLLEAGVDIHTIQVFMGHSSMKSTALYLHMARKSIAPEKSPLDLLFSQ